MRSGKDEKSPSLSVRTCLTPFARRVAAMRASWARFPEVPADVTMSSHVRNTSDGFGQDLDEGKQLVDLSRAALGTPELHFVVAHQQAHDDVRIKGLHDQWRLRRSRDPCPANSRGPHRGVVLAGLRGIHRRSTRAVSRQQRRALACLQQLHVPEAAESSLESRRCCPSLESIAPIGPALPHAQNLRRASGTGCVVRVVTVEF